MRNCQCCGVDIQQLYHNRKYCESDACRKEIDRRKALKHRKLHPGRNRESIHRYAATEHGRATLLLNNAKDRAKRYGLEYDLDLDFVLPKLRHGRCEITGVEFDFTVLGKRANPLCPSLDRIIPKKGYVRSNVRMICFVVNVMHHDWDDDLLLKMSRLIVENSHNLKLET